MNELVKGYSDMPALDFYSLAGTVLLKLGEAPGSTEFADIIPPIEDLGAARLNYGNALDAEDSESITILRESTRSILNNVMQRIAGSCESIANGDLVMLSHTGFPFKKTPEHSHEPPTAPLNLRLKNGPGSGVITAAVDRPDHTNVLELQTTADAMIGPWSVSRSYTNSRHMEWDGLPPLTMIFVRSRAIGANGPSEWSDIAEIAVT